MTSAHASLLALCAILPALSVLSAAPVLKLVEQTPPASEALSVPWVDAAKPLPALEKWARLPLTAPDGSTRAEARVLLTSEGFLLDLTVQDPDHVASRGGANLWQGDSLQLALDLHGDGTGSTDANARGPFGADDMALGIAIPGAAGEGWIFFRDPASGKAGPLPDGMAEVTRDATSTHYRLTLPWSLFNAKPGASREIGVALLLNDFSAGDKTPQRSEFGRGADGVPRPGLHARLRIADPAFPIAVARVADPIAWSAAEPAAVKLAAGAPKPLRITARFPEAKPLEFSTPADGRIHRYLIEISGSEAAAAPLTLRVDGAADKPLLEFQTDIINPQTVLAAFTSRIDELLAKPGRHPLFTHHLRSIHALVLAEWSRLQIYRTTNPPLARKTLDRIAKYTQALHAETGDWEAYLDGRRSLLMAFVSPHDGTLQVYQLGLPRDWDPEKSYPLFFELHGAGDDNPLAFPSNRLMLGEAAPGLHGYTTPKTYAEIQRNGYWVHPFGRGNLGYRGIAETDIFEVYDDVHARFKIDENRRYLYGFSMGGGGTWANALRTPDRWAAIAILAGAPRGDLGKELIPNIRQLPAWIWCGEDDGLFPRTKDMVAALRENGIEPVFSSTPGVGHSYLGEKQKESLDWLQTHTRQRPAEFEFRTDSDSRTSAWGVSLVRDPAISGIPGFKVRIKDNTVHIDSEGTRQLTVSPGPGGLGLKGDFTLLWNGKEVYRGPVCDLRLADGQATPTPGKR